MGITYLFGEEVSIHDVVEHPELVKERIVREGYDPTYGARPLKRTIQRLVLFNREIDSCAAAFCIRADVDEVFVFSIKRKQIARRSHRRTTLSPSQVQLNTDEGIRAAFYDPSDAAGFSSLREYARQIDLLYPE